MGFRHHVELQNRGPNCIFMIPYVSRSERGKMYWWCRASRSSLPCGRGWWLEEAQGMGGTMGGRFHCDYWLVVDTYVEGFRGQCIGMCVTCTWHTCIVIPDKRKVHVRNVFKHPGYCAIWWWCLHGASEALASGGRMPRSRKWDCDIAKSLAWGVKDSALALFSGFPAILC